MKRSALLLVLILFLVLGVGFLVLIWIDMRSQVGHETQPSTATEPARRGSRHPDRGSSETEREPRSKRDADSCSSLGVACASQYFATWSWPADGSCQATINLGFPEPDRRCTPGGVVPGVTAETLRDPAWRTRCIRNCQSSEVQKRATYAWYGLPRPEDNTGQSQTCELDHLVPLELGGADGMGNIWPECGPADATLRERYFKQKDLVENYLAAKVRAGDMPLDEAQRGIATDWVQYRTAAVAHCKGARCDATD